MLRGLVLHRDEAVIVLNKPPGLAVQGGTRTERHLDGLLDALRFGHAERPRLVHRLDKETSGVLVIARSAAAAAFLTRAFREKTTRKIYWALVARRAPTAAGTDRAGAGQARRPGRRTGARRPRRGQARRHLLSRRRQRRRARRAGWRCCRSPGGPTSCARIARRSARRSSATANTAAPAPHLGGLPGARRLHLHARALVDPASAAAACCRSPRRCRRICGKAGNFSALPTDVEDPVCRAGAAGMKRFYRQAEIMPAAGGYGGGARRQSRSRRRQNALIVPSAALAAAMRGGMGGPARRDPSG